MPTDDDNHENRDDRAGSDDVVETGEIDAVESDDAVQTVDDVAAGETDETGELGALRSRRFDRVGVRSSILASAGGVLVLAVIMTASVTLGVTADDTAATAKTQRTAKADPSYLTPVGTLLGNLSLPRPALAGDTGTAGVPSGTAPRPTSPVASPSDPGDISTYSGGVGTLTPAGIATLAMAAGCTSSQAVTATAVAIAESGGSPSAQGDTTLMDATWDWSAGLWQIRGLRAERGTGQLRDSVANQQAASNAKAMYSISSGCTDWDPWTTYTRGIYESFLGVSQRAVDYVTRYARAHGGRLPTVPSPDPNATIPSGGGANGGADTASSGSGPAAGTKATPSTHPGGKPRGPGTGAPGKSAGTGTSGGEGGTGAKGGSTSGSSSSPSSTTPSLPVTIPSSLPVQLPSSLPVKLPSSLPVKLPSNLLPSVGLGLN